MEEHPKEEILVTEQTQTWIPNWWKWAVLTTLVVLYLLLFHADETAGLGLAIFLGFYFAPSIIAWIRHHQFWSVFLVNFFFGVTLIGWIIALIMAVRDNQPQVVTVIHRPSE